MSLSETGYFRFNENKTITTINVDNTILVDVDKDGKIVGIETIGKKFSFEVSIEILKSFVYPEVITLPTGKPILLRV